MARESHRRLVSGSKLEDELRRVWEEVRGRWLEPLRQALSDHCQGSGREGSASSSVGQGLSALWNPETRFLSTRGQRQCGGAAECKF